ncbi:hypothetical protein PMAYCL1PPCAC_24950, partial [Pristionchus mayeri]
ANSAEYILQLSDRFQIVEFLISVDNDKGPYESEKVPFAEKLRIADQYRLYGLQEHCLSSLTSKDKFHAVKNSSVFLHFSDEMKFALFERLFEVSR